MMHLVVDVIHRCLPNNIRVFTRAILLLVFTSLYAQAETPILSAPVAFEKLSSGELIVLICATGGRSAHITRILEKNGIMGVIDVSEGMFGNGTARGWIACIKLPIEQLQAFSLIHIVPKVPLVH